MDENNGARFGTKRRTFLKGTAAAVSAGSLSAGSGGADEGEAASPEASGAARTVRTADGPSACTR